MSSLASASVPRHPAAAPPSSGSSPASSCRCRCRSRDSLQRGRGRGALSTRAEASGPAKRSTQRRLQAHEAVSASGTRGSVGSGSAQHTAAAGGVRRTCTRSSGARAAAAPRPERCGTPPPAPGRAGRQAGGKKDRGGVNKQAARSSRSMCTPGQGMQAPQCSLVRQGPARARLTLNAGRFSAGAPTTSCSSAYACLPNILPAAGALRGVLKCCLQPCMQGEHPLRRASGHAARTRGAGKQAPSRRGLLERRARLAPLRHLPVADQAQPLPAERGWA